MRLRSNGLASSDLVGKSGWTFWKAEAATLIQVVAQDRPGLLYDLTSAISSAGCNIDLVLIDTEAHKAIDVFYVTAEARKLEAAAQAALRERLLAACAS
ncbi:MAG: ACT domain-containing protein [Bryobacteraceae bacterium]